MDLGIKVAEVIEASSAEFVAQCYKLGQAPFFGTLVKARDGNCEIHGIVYNVETGSLDPGRRVVARGEEMETEDEIFRTNPQLEKLLTTTFQVLIVGYREGDNLYHYLPPKPVPIHSFVYTCQPEEVEAFTQSLNFLSLLIDARLSIPVDEIIAACLRSASRAYPDSEAFLIRAGRVLVQLLGGDSNRLNSILKRVR